MFCLIIFMDTVFYSLLWYYYVVYSLNCCAFLTYSKANPYIFIYLRYYQNILIDLSQHRRFGITAQQGQHFYCYLCFIIQLTAVFTYIICFSTIIKHLGGSATSIFIYIIVMWGLILVMAAAPVFSHFFTFTLFCQCVGLRISYSF